MTITLIRVINQQTINRSILLDKLDDGQANTEGYASLPKQKVYVPYSNPFDSSVRGYIDLIPTDRVLLSANRGTIAGLGNAGRISYFAFPSILIADPTIVDVTVAGINISIDGTTFLSVAPDVTYVKFTNPAGVSQTIPSTEFDTFSAIEIVIPAAKLTIGVIGVGWAVEVIANSKNSNAHVM